MKILHVITGLYTGGAETMLAKLLSQMPRGETESAVISLTGGGPLAERIADLGIPVTLLNMARGGASLGGFIRLLHMMRRHKPDLVQTWMYHANLLGGLAAKLAGRPPVLWGIRQSDLDPRMSKRSTIAVAKLGARLSHRLPHKIICCAETARAVHSAMGYAAERMLVIPNGFDLDVFCPSDEARLSVRRELSLDAGTLLIALPARFDRQKDHQGFLTAAGLVHRTHPAVHYVLCGDGVDTGNPELAGWIADQNLSGVCHPLGPRPDMARIMAACDVVVSASAFGEGFPNVLGEAMAAGTPCVATDVGDSRIIVGEAGRVVPPRDPAALAGALMALIALSDRERRAIGAAARTRIAEHYEIGVIAARFTALYHETLATKG